jgi:hypothetical protein
MLSVTYAEFQIKALNGKRRYAESHYAECRVADRKS